MNLPAPDATRAAVIIAIVAIALAGVLMGAYGQATGSEGDLVARAEAHDAPTPLKVTAAMLLARRARWALVAGDTAAFEAAQHELGQLWADLRQSLPGRESAELAALDRALTMAMLAGDAGTESALQRAAQALVADDDPPPVAPKVEVVR